MSKYKIKQPIIQEIRDSVHLDCPHCQLHKTVKTDNIQLAYDEINKFRIAHEHIIKT